MKRILFFLALLSFSGLIILGFTADDTLKNLLAQLERYHNRFPQEKVHLHFDKPYYTIGEDIWFKAYTVKAERNQLSGLSKILYVDLIDDKGVVEKALRLPIVAGLSWGDFKLTDSLSEGNYRVRAYTNWMRNFDEAFFFTKNIRVINAYSGSTIARANYTFDKTGNRQNVTALLTYTDISGKPLAGKEVNYTVQLNLREISKGKGTTDEKGQLTVHFVNAQPFVLKSGRINTTIALKEKEVVAKSFLLPTTSDEIDVQFFPEGGDLVNGLRTTVAFKAVGADGLGISVSGQIVDNNNKAVAEFKSGFAGMGSFLLLPQQGSSYTAVIKFEDGQEKRYPLPAAEDKGYSLNINNSKPDSIFIRVSLTKDQLESGEITLVGQHNGVVYYASKAPTKSPVFTASIPKSRFPAGITQFTLFSTAFQPVAERLVFIQNNKSRLNISLSAGKPVSKPREKVKMAITVKDAAGKPVQGSFSLAVTNETRVPSDDADETTIFSNLLLSSDLKGFIEQPNYYFTDVSPEKIKQLDNLMLTQGWRRFTWKNIMMEAFPAIVYQAEKSIAISGRVTTPGGKPIAGGKVMLLTTSGNGLLLDTVTNEDGRFSFDNLVFNDSTKFVVQARNAKDRKNVEVELDRNPPPLVSLNKNEAAVEVNLSPSLITYLQNSKEQFDLLKKYGLLNRVIVLDEVKVVEEKPAVKNSSNLNGAGNADAVIRGEQLENYSDLSMALQGRVAGLIISNGVPYLTRNMGTPMQIILDGMPVESDYLTMIPPTDVESIEVLKSIGNTAIYGLRGGGGVLIINTKRGEANYGYNRYAPGIVSFAPAGYYVSREFYSPNYDDPQLDKHLPDLRTTIFWKPNIVTDENGKAVVEYFNADRGGTYKAVLEGLSIEGNLGREVFRYKVN